MNDTIDPNQHSEQGLAPEQITDLLRANGLDEVVARSRQLAVLLEITQQRTRVDDGDRRANWRLAHALERFALTIREPNARRRLFDEAFLCRRALDTAELSDRDRLTHLVCLSADALAAERRAELMMLLRHLPETALTVPATVEWPEELLLRVARAFTLMARRSEGWDDIRAAATEIQRLRELQTEREALMGPAVCTGPGAAA